MSVAALIRPHVFHIYLYRPRGVDPLDTFRETDPAERQPLGCLPFIADVARLAPDRRRWRRLTQLSGPGPAATPPKGPDMSELVPNDRKSWVTIFKTKTFWGGVASIATGASLIAAGDYPQGVQLIGAGLIAIFIRDGIRKLEPVK